MKSTFSILFSLILASAFSQNIIVEIDSEQPTDTISKHIYGHFAEHLGRCIYGGLYVGDDSKIPNTSGVRNDIIEALKELQIPNLRWPGGCFADTYHWKDAIGPKDQRKHIENYSWGNVREDNGFGTHEFLNLCEVPWVPFTFLIKSSSGAHFFFVRHYARSGFAFTEKSPSCFRSTYVERNAQWML